jgi:NADP-dependent 3-hydroxy acid dehydrogenase YdfG
MAKEPRSLVGKVVAITGGARGIGKATAQALVRKGAKVAIGDLDLDLAQRSAAEIGGETLALELDVTSHDSFEGFLDQVEERLGSLDVLVNNAGIMPVGPFVEETNETAHKMIDINVHGVLYGMKLALPRMQRRNTGHLVNIASQAGKGGFPGGATYCGTKHFVVGASEAVRQELRETAIEVSVVMPALVNTELTAGLPLSRGVKKVEPEDVADAIVDALEFPKFDVWVPRVSAGIFRVMSVLPRGAREALGRALNADKVLAEPDPTQRASYEQRAARHVASEEESEVEKRDTEAPIEKAAG